MREKLYEMFFPKLIAVIGASNKLDSHGGAMLERCLEFGFSGEIYPINPKRKEIFGLKCYESIIDVPKIPDAVFIVIPAAGVLKSLEECGERGVKNIIVVSAGFKEIGGDGVEREKRFMEVVKRYKLNIIGPNCPGFISDNIHFMMSVNNVKSGGVVIISQSGGVTAAMVDFAKRLGVGCKLIVGTGNKADLSEVDIMEAIISDERFLEGVKVVALYQESVVNAERLIKVTEKFSEKGIPVLALKSGRGSLGARAALSHTGAMASSDVAVDALFKKAGIVRVEGSQDLLNLACCFDKIAVPRGKRVAIVTNSGGPAVIAADFLEKYGLTLAEFSEETKAQLKLILNKFSAWCSVANPVDIIGGGSDQMFQEVTELLLKSDDNDMVLVTMPNPPFEGALLKVAHAITVSRRANINKPMFVVTMTDVKDDLRERYHYADLPIFLYPETAVKIMAQMYDHKASLRNKTFLRMSDYGLVRIKKNEVENILRKYKNEFLSQEDARKILEIYGLKFPKTVLAKNREQAEKYLAEFEIDGINEVYLKIESPDILHKSDAGCVKKAIMMPEEAEPVYVYDEIIENAKKYNFGARIKGVLIQESIDGGKEVLVGVKYEKGIGHLIGFGRGGIYTEVENDVGFRLAPLSVEEASDLIESVKFYKILRGVRGEKTVCFRELLLILLRISKLISDFPQIEEIDVNPVKAFPDKIICVDARIKVAE